MSVFWGAVAIAAGIASAFNLVPQLYKSWRTKRTNDLSYGTLIVVMSGNVLWMLHGMHHPDWALVVANVFLFATAAALIVLKARCDRAS